MDFMSAFQDACVVMARAVSFMERYVEKHVMGGACCLKCGKSARAEPKRRATLHAKRYGSEIMSASKSQLVQLISHSMGIAANADEAPLVWCAKCGQYAQQKLCGLVTQCAGMASIGTIGGAASRIIDRWLHPLRVQRLVSPSVLIQRFMA